MRDVTNFWSLLKESVIIQGIITLALLGVVLYLYAAGKPVPQELVSAFMLVLGFYFGSKVTAQAYGLQKKEEK